MLKYLLCTEKLLNNYFLPSPTYNIGLNLFIPSMAEIVMFSFQHQHDGSPAAATRNTYLHQLHTTFVLGAKCQNEGGCCPKEGDFALKENKPITLFYIFPSRFLLK